METMIWIKKYIIKTYYRIWVELNIKKKIGKGVMVGTGIIYVFLNREGFVMLIRIKFVG